MKLSSAFDSIARENRFLKLLTASLLLTTFLLLGIVYNLYDRSPLMMERTSRGLEILNPTEFARSQSDQIQVVKLMMKARFNTETNAPEIFLNPKQLLLRATEQADMKARGMSQSLIVREVKFENDAIFVNLDRVISVGELRSALKAKVRIAFETVTPNELNPYGLLLSLTEPIITKEHSR
jgi:hypothetical protein